MDQGEFEGNQVSTDARLLTVPDVAERLQVNRRTVYSWIQAGTLPRPDVDIGNIKRWKPKTIEDWIDSLNAKKG